MASIIKVDTIQDQDGNNIINENANTITIGASGDTITVPSGATFDASNATTTLPANVVTTDGSQTLTNKTIDASQLSDGTVTPAKLGYDYNQYRNIIINGDMNIAQRGTSATGLTNGSSGYYTCDRWRYVENGSTTSQFTMSQDTDVPTGQGFAKSLKMDCTTAQNPIGSSDAIYIEQKFEGQNLQYLKKGTASAENVTVSFWVKSNKTGDFGIALYDNDNARIIGNIYTINSVNTWEKKTITFAGDTTGTLDNDNGDSLSVWFHLDAGADRKSADNTSWGSSSSTKQAYGQTVNLADNTANEWFITGVQLEAGTTASDFEFLPFDVNLRRCIRYYTTSQGAANWGDFTTGADNGIYFGRVGAFSNQPCNHRFPVRMRTTPTITLYSLIGTSGSVSDTGTTAGTHVSDDTASPARISESGLGYLTGCSAGSGDGYAFQYEADAEI